MAVLCADDPHVRDIIPMISRPVTTYGIASESAQIYATHIRHDQCKMHFRAHIGVNGSARTLDITLNLPGKHNVLNALAAIAVGNELNVPDEAMVKALATFGGVDRRFQQYGEIRLPDRRSLPSLMIMDITRLKLLPRWRLLAMLFLVDAWFWCFSHIVTVVHGICLRILSGCYPARMHCC